MKDKKLILGIETSCDDTSVAIMAADRNGAELLSHLSYSQIEDLKQWGGVVPEIAARNHLAKIAPLIFESLKNAKVDSKNLDLIAVTSTPGLLGPLLTGVNAAKSLALINHTPILPVNHLYAHLEAIHLTESITYPYLGLLLSGGHSVFFLVQSASHFQVIGTTIDDACGEAFDKGGKLLGLGYPAGHIIDRLAQFGDEDKYSFPIGLKASANPQMSFSGLKTALRVFRDKHPELKAPKQFQTKEDEAQMFYDVCASYQKAISNALILKTRYALKVVKEKYNIPSIPIVLGGGVACNSKIRKDFFAKYKKTFFVEPQFCTDNGAMIANFGRLNFDQATHFPDCLKLDARGRFIEKGQR